ncbi:hypothetical protein [Corynebacterium sp. Marseille-P3884]|uniref:hypothetical protein n=1 Tax=Corynebacterium sp. Marseille-P3884 TaxID=2495409 RepID=UPI001B344C44|nr:hypothetical protein [Corynebacterium sp. Marseille-P3884]
MPILVRGRRSVQGRGSGEKKLVQAIKVHGSNHFWWYNPSTANDMWAVLSRVSK